MPRPDSVFNVDSETSEVLNQIRLHFDQDWRSDVILRYQDGTEVDVQMIHSVVYYFEGHRTSDARCIVSFLELDTGSGSGDEERAQLFHVEHQKRGLAHVHIMDVKLWAKRAFTTKDVEELLAEEWEH